MIYKDHSAEFETISDYNWEKYKEGSRSLDDVIKTNQELDRVSEKYVGMIQKDFGLAMKQKHQRDEFARIGKAPFFMIFGGFVYIVIALWFFLFVNNPQAGWVSVSTVIAFWLLGASMSYEPGALKLIYDKIVKLENQANKA
jgi:hypothetical protein